MRPVSVLLVGSSVDAADVRKRYRNAGVLLAPPLGLYRLKCYLESRNLARIHIFDPNLHREDVQGALASLLTDSERYDIVEFSRSPLSGIVGTHIGPGGWGIFYQTVRADDPLDPVG